jgi:DNA-binding NarL/FixJ family response regulator
MVKPFRLLIVDDQPRARQSLKALLAISFPLIEVCEATNGIEALQCVEASMPDVVIMDVRMPELDGISTTRLIKAVYPQVKVILLSMYDNYQVAALAAGADDFVTKEKPNELIMATARVID